MEKESLFLKFSIILFVNCQDITGTGGSLLMINFRYEGEETVNIELHSLNLATEIPRGWRDHRRASLCCVTFFTFLSLTS